MVTWLMMASLSWGCDQPLCAVSVVSLDGEALHLTPGTTPQVVDIGPDLLLGGTVFTRHDPRHADAVTVRQRAVSVVTLMAEGPHLDLYDGPRGRTDDTVLAPTRPGVFSLAPSPEGPLPFPTDDPADLHEAIRQHLGGPGPLADRWVEHVDRCTDVRSYPCAVVLGQVELEVCAVRDGDVVACHTVALRPALGC
jgi:hypothetical protein